MQHVSKRWYSPQKEMGMRSIVQHVPALLVHCFHTQSGRDTIDAFLHEMRMATGMATITCLGLLKNNNADFEVKTKPGACSCKRSFYPDRIMLAVF